MLVVYDSFTDWAIKKPTTRTPFNLRMFCAEETLIFSMPYRNSLRVRACSRDLGEEINLVIALAYR